MLQNHFSYSITFTVIYCFLTVFIFTTTASASECGFRHKFSQKDEKGSKLVKVYQSKPLGTKRTRVLAYITSLKINTDGTRISYNENDPTGRKCYKKPTAKGCAINNIKNAFRKPSRPISDFINVRDANYPSRETWRLLSPHIIEKSKADGKPCRSRDGYLVSMTADVSVSGGFTRQGDCSQSKWIDALTIPAIVIPQGPKKNGKRTRSKFSKLGVKKRSLAIGFSRKNTNTIAIGIVGDAGSDYELGEANVAFNRALNNFKRNDRPKSYIDAKDRFQVKLAATIVVPGNKFVLSRPLTSSRVAKLGKALVEDLGGLKKLRRCISKEIDKRF